MFGGNDIETFLEVIQGRIRDITVAESSPRKLTNNNKAPDQNGAIGGDSSHLPVHCCAAEKDIAILQARLKEKFKEGKWMHRELFHTKKQYESQLGIVQQEYDEKTRILNCEVEKLQEKMGELQCSKDGAVKALEESRRKVLELERDKELLYKENESIRDFSSHQVELEQEKHLLEAKVQALTSKVQEVDGLQEQVTTLKTNIADLENQKMHLIRHVQEMEELQQKLKERDEEKDEHIDRLSGKVSSLELQLRKLIDVNDDSLLTPFNDECVCQDRKRLSDAAVGSPFTEDVSRDFNSPLLTSEHKLFVSSDVVRENSTIGNDSGYFGYTLASEDTIEAAAWKLKGEATDEQQISVYQTQIHSLQSEKEQLITLHETEMCALKRTLDFLKTERDSEILHLQTRLDEMQSSKDEAIAKCQTRLEKMLLGKEAKISHLKSEVAERKPNKLRIMNLLTKLEEKDVQIGEVLGEIQELEDTKEEQLLELEEKIADLMSSKEEEIEILQEKLSCTQQERSVQVYELETKLAKITAAKDEAICLLESKLHASQKAKDEEVLLLQQRLSKLTAEKDSEVEQLRCELDTLIAKKEVDVEELSSKVDELESAKLKHDKELQQLRDEVSKVNNDKSILIEAMERLQDAKQNELKTITVDVEAERKEAASLASKLQNAQQEAKTYMSRVTQVEEEQKKKTELHLLEIKSMNEHINQILLSKKEEVGSLTTKIQSLENEIKETRRQHYNEVEVLEQKLTDMDQRLASKSVAFSELDTSAEKLDKEDIWLKQTDSILGASSDLSDSVFAERRLLVAELQTKVTEQEGSLTQKEEELREARTQITELQHDVHHYRISLLTLDEILVRLQQKTELEEKRWEKQLNETLTQLQQVEADNEAFESRLDEVKMAATAVNEVEESVRLLQSQLLQKQEENDVLREKLSELESSPLSRENSIDFQSEELPALRTRSSLKQDLVTLRTELHTEIQKNQDLGREIRKLHCVIKTGYDALNIEQATVAELKQQLHKLSARSAIDNGQTELEELKCQLAEKERQLQQEIAVNKKLMAQLNKRKSRSGFPRSLLGCVSSKSDD